MQFPFSQNYYLQQLPNFFYQNTNFQEQVYNLQQSHWILLQKNSQLEKEVIQLRQWKKRRQDYQHRQELHQIRNSDQGQQKNGKRKYRPRRTYLEKKFCCEFEGCKGKYSSKIAMNSHLRKKHNLSGPKN